VKSERTNHEDGNSSLWERIYAIKSYALLLGIGLLSALLFFLASRERDQVISTVEFAIASSLAASAIFSLLQLYFTRNEFVELLTAEARLENARVIKAVQDSISQISVRHIPLAHYEPTGSLKSEFNDDVTAALSATRNYWFRGLTGIHVSRRLRTSGTTLDSLKLILADPRDEAALNFRLRYEMAASAVEPARDYALAIEQTRQKILQSVIGLYEIRLQCQVVEVLFSRSVPPDRTEIFDDTLFITLFDWNEQRGYEFPESYRFGSHSLMYSVARRDFDLQFTRAGTNKVLRIKAQDNFDVVEAHMRAFGYDIESNAVRLRAAFSEQATEFGRQMRSGS
jgi:hypothetical protein